MSDSMNRRDFLKLLGGSSAALAVGGFVPKIQNNPLLKGMSQITREEAVTSWPSYVKEVDEPTYVKDIVGEIGKFDARMRGFAMSTYFPGDGYYEKVYELYPHLKGTSERLWAWVDPPAKHAERAGISEMGWILSNFGILPCVFLNNEAFLNPAPAERVLPVEDEQDMAYRIKQLGYSMGAGDVKIGPLNQNWLYSHLGQNKDDTWGQEVVLNHKTAISMAFPQNLELMLNGDGPAPNAELLWVYSVMANAAVVMAQTIAQLGYQARAHTVANYHLLQVPVALDAGMGEMGRMGYIIHPIFGSNFRLITVTTDLPLAYDKPVDFGLQDFCDRCKLCAENCPPGAIPMGSKEVATDNLHSYGGIKKWYIDPVACLEYWGTNGTDCGICHTSCPWSKKDNWVHQLGRRVATVEGFGGTALPSLETTFYGSYAKLPTPDWLK